MFVGVREYRSTFVEEIDCLSQFFLVPIVFPSKLDGTLANTFKTLSV